MHSVDTQQHASSHSSPLTRLLQAVLSFRPQGCFLGLGLKLLFRQGRCSAWQRQHTVRPSPLNAPPLLCKCGADAAGIPHLHTWNETALWWRMHTRQENGNIECTHFCGPGPYHLWVWLQTELVRSMELPPLGFVPVVPW